jgi:thiamine-phosphate pyrophosphorylase
VPKARALLERALRSGPVKAHGLYPIVDLDSLAKLGLSPVAFAEQVLAARPSLLQLRAKSAGARETLALLRRLKPLCDDAGTLLFANDRPDLALIAGVAGVHVGQDDLPLAEVRRFAPRLLVGVSTHNRAQFEAALAERPDYVALGPIFATSSKQNPDPVVGLAELGRAAELARAENVPLVAIGGIDHERAAELAKLGVIAAVIGALLPEADGSVSAQARSLQALFG